MMIDEDCQDGDDKLAGKIAWMFRVQSFSWLELMSKARDAIRLVRENSISRGDAEGAEKELRG